MISSQQKNELRERLLATESTSQPLRLEYERKVSAMFDVQLTALKKSILIGLIITSVVIGIGVLALVLTENMPPRVNGALLTGVGFAAAWTIYFVQLLVRGTYRRRIDTVWAAAMKFGFALTMCVLLAIAGLSTDKVILAAMFTIVPASLFVIYAIVDRSEMRTQERLVELQYRLATLSERLGGEDDNLGAGVPR